jgi:D-glycero-D-manno-heptose 1,7-bisphosphate phosphatase
LISDLKPGAAVFLDRDGTLIRDVGYLRRIDDLEILPKVPEALCLLRAQGFKLVLVTNQSAVARGWLLEEELAAIHAALGAALARGGARLDAIYYCPHHPVEGQGAYRLHCACRKPDIGMIERAAVELGVGPAASYVVGDQQTDVELARRAGATALLIDREPPPSTVAARPGAVVGDLWQAARWIVEHARQSGNAEESQS